MDIDHRRIEIVYRWQNGQSESVIADHLGLSQVTAYASTAARAHTIRHAVADADFVLDRIPWRANPDDLLYDPTCFSYADIRITRNHGQTAIVTLTGSELVDFHDRWIQERQMVAFPSIDPNALEPDRIYRIASQPALFWLAGARQQNFRMWNPHPIGILA